MSIRLLKPYTPSTRHQSYCNFKFLTQQQPQKHLLQHYSRANGRNSTGHITSRHRGGGHKRRFRQIDFQRKSYCLPMKILAFEYDPNRSVYLSLIKSFNGTKQYILKSEHNKIGDIVISHSRAPISSGNVLPLKNIPLGTQIHNIEIHPGKGAQLVRSAGTSAQVIAKELKYVTIKLPSGEVRNILNHCWATIGELSNFEWNQIQFGKAGRKRWLNKRPSVRGSVMNAVDHPHGGGEGRSPIGKTHPVTPWGVPTLGKKTRQTRKYSNSLILKQRK
uniref:Large ribosomal subunit protein uL2c n=1 Tax=Codium arabicum TaxID=221038 RepID=A0A386B0J5_CODAR|nr:ribosomal protein L2 [Codium arabicum]AYC65210.1 ribosomal protein L2 [Codium arabicum]